MAFSYTPPRAPTRRELSRPIPSGFKAWADQTNPTIRPMSTLYPDYTGVMNSGTTSVAVPPLPIDLVARGVTSFDPRSKEFLDSLPIGLGYVGRTGDQASAYNEANHLSRLFRTKTTNGVSISSVFGCAINSKPRFKKSMDFFLVTSPNGCHPDKLSTCYSDACVFIQGSWDFPKSDSSALRRSNKLHVNSFSLPRGEGICYSYLLRCDTRVPSSVFMTEGVIVNIWIIKEYLLNGFAGIPSEYEGGGVAYDLVRHYFKYLGLDLNPDSSIDITLKINGSLLKERLPFNAKYDLRAYINSTISCSGETLDEGMIYERFLSRGNASSDMFGIDRTTRKYVGPNELKLRHPWFKSFVNWYEKGGGYAPGFLSYGLKETLQDFSACIGKGGAFAELGHFVESVRRTAIDKQISEIARTDWGLTETQKITIENYEKLLFRSKVAELSGVV